MFAETRGGSANRLADTARLQGSRAKEMRGTWHIVYADSKQIQRSQAGIQSGQRSSIHRRQRAVCMPQWYKLDANAFKCLVGYVGTLERD